MTTLGARGRLTVVAVVGVTAIAGLAVSGLSDSVVYYATPSELAESAGREEVLRVGGLVADGSVRASGEGVAFTLTDGVADLAVVHTAELRGVFQEGQGALVEGRLGDDGVFRSQLLMVQHDNEYRDGDDTEYRVPVEGVGE